MRSSTCPRIIRCSFHPRGSHHLAANHPGPMGIRAICGPQPCWGAGARHHVVPNLLDVVPFSCSRCAADPIKRRLVGGITPGTWKGGWFTFTKGREIALRRGEATLTPGGRPPAAGPCTLSCAALPKLAPPRSPLWGKVRTNTQLGVPQWVTCEPGRAVGCWNGGRGASGE
jgi:hypothetical protein